MVVKNSDSLPTTYSEVYLYAENNLTMRRGCEREELSRLYIALEWCEADCEFHSIVSLLILNRV